MQDPRPMVWGAMDRFQAHFIVKTKNHTDADLAAKTILDTQGHFGAKKLTGISWNGAGVLAVTLNADNDLTSLLLKRTLKEAQIYIEPGDDCVRIHGKWSNGLEFGITKEMFEIYDRIAGHIKAL
ncbi:MAG: hypothetical protein K8823_893 [Cenarchaeum symbiont of Oopsacas minuta]|nr:hypothetical protein [Cenarchaeum symbiont of Oopsacas minuta]